MLTRFRSSGVLSWSNIRFMSSTTNLSDPAEVEKLIQIMPLHREHYGTGMVRSRFKVPVRQIWPKALHRYPVGQIAAHLRELNASNTLDATIKAKLDTEGFIWEESEFDHVMLPILQRFRQVHQHFRISKTYVVPKNAAWPRYMQGYKLGLKIHAIRNKVWALTSDQEAILNDMGFKWNPNVDRWRHMTFPALKHFHATYGHCKLSRRFIVPKDATKWPVEFHQFPLGRQHDMMRKGLLYNVVTSDDQAELEALGYYFKPLIGKRKKNLLPSNWAY